jgi:hypothetical protein
LRRAGARGHNFHAALAIVFQEPVRQLAGRWVGQLCDECPINLFDAAGLKLLGESIGSFAGAGQNKKATDCRVETADDAEINIAGLVVFMLEIFLGEGNDAGNSLDHALRGEARRLVDDQKMVVFVEDFQGRLGHAEYYTVALCLIFR